MIRFFAFGMSILLYFFASFLHATPRCGNTLVVNYSGPGVSEINVTGIPVGTVIGNTYLQMSGRCEQSGAHGEIYIKTQVTSPTVCSPDGYMTDPSGVVKLRACNNNSEIVWAYAPFTLIGYSNNIIPVNSSIILAKKIPGRTLIDLNALHGGFAHIYSAAGSYGGFTERENTALVSGNFSPFYVTYTPQCNVHLINNDINFGNVSGNLLSLGLVVEQYADLRINCNDTISKYTLNLQPVHGVADAAQGFIHSKENSTVGFSLRWGNYAIGNHGVPVTFNQELPALLPARDNIILFKVKPVSLVPGRVKGGPATSSLNMVVTFE